MMNIVMHTGQWFCHGIIIQETAVNQLYSLNGHVREDKKFLQNFGGETCVKLALWKDGKEIGNNINPVCATDIHTHSLMC